jgi:hypothetical protein
MNISTNPTAMQIPDSKLPTTRRVTFATMIRTDGTNTVYGVYRGDLQLSGKPHIDLNRNCIHVISIERMNQHWHNEELAERYLEMTRPYATDAAPAFCFTECQRCFGIRSDCCCKETNPNYTCNA